MAGGYGGIGAIAESVGRVAANRVARALAKKGMKSKKAKKASTKKKMKQKSIKSYTKTKVSKKRKVKDTEIPDAITQEQKGMLVNKYPKKLKIMKGVAVNYRRLVQTKCTSSAGVQNISVIGVYGTTNQWMYSQTPALDPLFDESEAAWFQLNPNAKTTGSAILGAISPANDQFFLKTVDVAMEITNLSNVAAEATILWVKAKENMEFNTGDRLDFTTQWNNILIAERQTGDNVQEQATGGVAGAAVAGTFGNATSNVVGEYPSSLKGWRRLWKVLGTERFDLAPGASHRINTTLHYNYLGKMDEIIGLNKYYTNSTGSWTSGNTTVPVLKNGTVYAVMIYHGAPVDDESDPATKRITYGKTSLGVINNSVHKFKSVYGDAGRINSKTVMQNVPASGTTQKVLQEYTNAVTSALNVF